jgi:hypothetical protein
MHAKLDRQGQVLVKRTGIERVHHHGAVASVRVRQRPRCALFALGNGAERQAARGGT